jgi:uncharacterized protein (DUF1697 family)
MMVGMADAFVVFYRNMNLGHPKSPDRALLEGALRDAGAVSVQSFQTNGTVVFETGRKDARKVVEQAAHQLTEQSGYRDAAFVRPLENLTAVLNRSPFEGHRDERTYRETFTFFDGGKPFGAELPWTNPRDDVDIISIEEGLALSVIRKSRGTAGSPTAELEKRLEVPATTRTAGTVERLVRTFQRA